MSILVINLVQPIANQLIKGSVMKKKTTLVNQPGKTETIKSELLPHQVHVQILYHSHTFCDHSHGRVNKYPFGGSHGPGAF